MGRLAALGIAALVALLAAGCAGTLGQAPFSLPSSSDDLQTVSDAADSLVHRTSATANAKAAIGVTNALGSVVRDLSAQERLIFRLEAPGRPGFGLRNGLALSTFNRAPDATGVISGSQFLIQPRAAGAGAYCETTAGFSAKGIPSLGETFGWQSGVYAGGTRLPMGAASSVWSADAVGAVVRAPVGGLRLVRDRPTPCPMLEPALAVAGGTASNAFSIPLSLTYRRAHLTGVAVTNATFSDGATLNVNSAAGSRLAVSGSVANGALGLATFRTNFAGNGTLTITSSGAQYVITNWIVAGT